MRNKHRSQKHKLPVLTCINSSVWLHCPTVQSVCVWCCCVSFVGCGLERLGFLRWQETLPAREHDRVRPLCFWSLREELWLNKKLNTAAHQDRITVCILHLKSMHGVALDHFHLIRLFHWHQGQRNKRTQVETVTVFTGAVNIWWCWVTRRRCNVVPHFLCFLCVKGQRTGSCLEDKTTNFKQPTLALFLISHLIKQSRLTDTHC